MSTFVCTDNLNCNSYFNHYALAPCSEDLTLMEQTVALVCTVALTVFSGGFLFLLFYCQTYEKLDDEATNEPTNSSKRYIYEVLSDMYPPEVGEEITIPYDLTSITTVCSCIAEKIGIKQSESHLISLRNEENEPILNDSNIQRLRCYFIPSYISRSFTYHPTDENSE